LENNKFYSQAGQDKWVCELFSFKKDGFFIDLGAYDGIQTSNTYFLEKELNWKGICVEANENIFKLLQANRTSENIYGAVTNYNGLCYFRDDKIVNTGIPVNCFTLKNILDSYSTPKQIDYLSIDIEGNEYTVFKDFNFNEYEIKCMTVEHNLYCDGPEKKDMLFHLLSNAGFERVVEDAPCLDPNPLYYMKPYEDWYVNKKYLNLIK
jgi:FkbM family methyltransferase